MVKDIFGNEVHAGDYVIYAVKGTKYGDPLRMGLITKMTERCHLNYKGDKVFHNSMTVACKTKNWRGQEYTRKSHIDQSRTFIKLSDTDSAEFKARGLVP
jgi:hypothetical protein